MDKDLEELKVKAQQMLKKCREGDLSVENLPDVRKSLNNLLNDIKSHKLLEDVEFMKIAKELGNEVVNFINTDLAELQKSAEEKISAAVDERELQDAKVFYLGKKGKLTAILKNMKDVPQTSVRLSALQRIQSGLLLNLSSVKSRHSLRQSVSKARLKMRPLILHCPPDTIRPAMSIHWTKL